MDRSMYMHPVTDVRCGAQMVGIGLESHGSAATQMSSGGSSTGASGTSGTGGRAGSDPTVEALSPLLMGGAGASSLGPGPGSLSSEVGPGGMLRALSSNSQDTSAPPPPAPPPALTAAASAAAASSSASTGNQLAARDSGTSATAAAIESIEWEAGTLLMGQEETDEKSLRMVMKNSMDIHRLMRSRQKVKVRFLS